MDMFNEKTRPEEYKIPKKVKRPAQPRQLKQYDRKSPDFYQALAVAHNSEAHSLENSDEKFAGKAALIKQYREKAAFYGKMAVFQAKAGITRKWTR